MGARHLTARLLDALDFAAEKHRLHRRKDPEASPYVNHAIRVASILAGIGGVEDLELLQAAVLHDTLEDTETTPAELEERFGAAVARLVLEVTDDKTLPKPERKRLQIARAPQLSRAARQLRLADKIANVQDVAFAAPHDWTLDRRRDYLDWAEHVAAGCRGVNPALDHHFAELLKRCRARLDLGRIGQVGLPRPASDEHPLPLLQSARIPH